MLNALLALPDRHTTRTGMLQDAEEGMRRALLWY